MAGPITRKQVTPFSPGVSQYSFSVRVAFGRFSRAIPRLLKLRIRRGGLRGLGPRNRVAVSLFLNLAPVKLQPRLGAAIGLGALA